MDVVGVAFGLFAAAMAVCAVWCVVLARRMPVEPPAQLEPEPQPEVPSLPSVVVLGRRRVCKDCADARRDGHPELICDTCAPLLVTPTRKDASR